MNFLAHAYLSFNHPELLVGNMISDFVKGKKKFDYPDGIQKGIMLHRMIDTFTDEHPATHEAKQFLRPASGLYAGAFIDVIYDHFLANDPNEFDSQRLHEHALYSYQVLNKYFDFLPERFQQMLPYMEAQNWLYNYRSMSGTQSSFGGLVRRAAYMDSSAEVFRLFEIHYSSLQKCYNAFFPFVKAFTIHQIEELTKQ